MAPRGGRVFVQQERAHRRVGHIGRVDRLDQRVGDGVGGLGEADQPVDGLGELGGAARPVAQLAGDEARVQRAGAHHPRHRLRQRPGARAVGVGGVEHHQIGLAAQRRDRRGEPADEGDIGRPLQEVPARIVARYGSASPRPPPARRRRPPPPGPRPRRRRRRASPRRDRRGRARPGRSSRRSPAAPPGRRHRCRGPSRRCAPAAARGGERVLGGGLVPRGDRGDRGVDQRDLRAEHVAEQARDAPGHVHPRPAEQRRGQHLDPGDARRSPRPTAGGSPSAPALARSPRRRCAGWRCPRGRAPARAASRHAPARTGAAPRRRRRGRAPRRSASAGCADRR